LILNLSWWSSKFMLPSEVSCGCICHSVYDSHAFNWLNDVDFRDLFFAKITTGSKRNINTFDSEIVKIWCKLFVIENTSGHLYQVRQASKWWRLNVTVFWKTLIGLPSISLAANLLQTEISIVVVGLGGSDYYYPISSYKNSKLSLRIRNITASNCATHCSIFAFKMNDLNTLLNGFKLLPVSQS
jgi:hypothetical protein